MVQVDVLHGFQLNYAWSYSNSFNFFKVLFSWHGQHKLLQLFKSHLVLLVSLYKSKIIRCCTVNIVTLSLPILEKLFFWGFTHFSTSTYYGTTSAVWETTARQLAKFKCKFLVASKIHFILAGLASNSCKASRNLKTFTTITGLQL